MEVWKQTKYNNYYVSNMGRVKSIFNNIERILNPASDGNYLHVTIHFGHHVQKTQKVHRLVAEAFIENPNNWRCVNHKNGVKHDNRVENLEWCTHRYNAIHSTLVLKNKRCGEKVKCVETGDVFKSCADCEKIIGRANGSISKCLQGKSKTCARYHWVETDEEPTKNIDIRKYKRKKYAELARDIGIPEKLFYSRMHWGRNISEMWHPRFLKNERIAYRNNQKLPKD